MNFNFSSPYYSIQEELFIKQNKIQIDFIHDLILELLTLKQLSFQNHLLLTQNQRYYTKA